jgi:hypothetical protein
MAHFAQLDSNNVVINVIVVNNTELGNPTGLEKEQEGVQFCKEHFGENTLWKQTSYNKNFRGNFAGLGFTYDSTLDKFVPPKPFASWVLNQNTWGWEAPTPIPDITNLYRWDEATTSWIRD